MIWFQLIRWFYVQDVKILSWINSCNNFNSYCVIHIALCCIIFHDSCGCSCYVLQSISMTCSSLGSDYKRGSDQAYLIQCLAPITFVWRGLLPGAQISYHHFLSLQFIRFHMLICYQIGIEAMGPTWRRRSRASLSTGNSIRHFAKLSGLASGRGLPVL